ncbi:MAG: hypothetical protein LEGION0398_MBIBDBAK_01182 [Legionellaceae bacterium]
MTLNQNNKFGLFKDSKLDNEAKNNLRQSLPDEWDSGISLNTGDCFFDSIAQSLNFASLQEKNHTAKTLRIISHQYIIDIDKKPREDNWIYQRFLVNAKNGNKDSQQVKEIADKAYQHYFANIQYTYEDILNGQGLNLEQPIWGEQDIDGRILSEVLNIKLHIIELHENENNIVLGHQLIDKENSKSVVEKDIDYSNNAILHLCVYRNHYAPLLPKAELVKLQQENSNQNSFTQLVIKVENKDKLLLNNSFTQNTNLFYQKPTSSSVSKIQLKKELVYDDDSSDEETINEAMQSFDLVSSYKKFKQSQTFFYWKNDINFPEEHIPFAFLLHSMGIELLYAKPVNNVYYPNKELLLKSKNNEEKILAFIKKSLIKTISEIIETYLPEYFCDPKNIIQKLKTEDFASLQKEILSVVEIQINQTSEKLFEHFTSDKEKIKELLRYENLFSFENSIVTITNELQHSIFQLITEKSEKYGYNYYPTSDIQYLNQPECHLIKLELLELAKEKAIQELIRLGFLDNYGKKLYSKGKGLDPNLLTYYPYLAPESGRLLSSNKKGTSAQGNSSGLNSTFDLPYYYILDLTQRCNHKDDDEILNLLSKYPKLKQFFNVRSELLFREITNNFSSILSKQLVKARNRDYYRNTLNEQTQFIINSSLDLLTHLRLANRDQKRKIRNYKNSLFNSLYSGNQKRHTYRNWLFQGEYLVQENQGIIISSEGRQDKIDNAGKYSDIYERFQKIQNHFLSEYQFAISDKMLVNWVRAMIKNEEFNDINNRELGEVDKTILFDFIAEMTYLLFGCEVARNPASLIVHQIILDLILNEKISLQSALFDNVMPMAVSEAVGKARSIQNKLNPYMPYFYTYPGTESNDNIQTNNMLASQAAIFRQWLEVKYNYKNDMLDLQKIRQIILNNLERWFGIQQLSFNNNYNPNL